MASYYKLSWSINRCHTLVHLSTLVTIPIHVVHLGRNHIKPIPVSKCDSITFFGWSVRLCVACGFLPTCSNAEPKQKTKHAFQRRTQNLDQVHRRNRCHGRRRHDPETAALAFERPWFIWIASILLYASLVVSATCRLDPKWGKPHRRWEEYVCVYVCMYVGEVLILMGL